MRNIQGLFVASTFFLSSVTALAKPITATLSLTERVSIHELARNVLDPSSDRFEQYYTPEEIRDICGPSDEDYNQLLEKLTSHGFSIVYESKTRLILSIQADHTKFEEYFNTRIQFSENVHSFSVPAQIPSDLELVSSITGLDNTLKFKPRYKIHKHFNEFSDMPGISPEDIRTAYGLNPLYSRGLTGKDQHIAIATYMSFVIEDAKQYFEKIELSPIPEVDLVTFNGPAPYDAESAGETTLDTEMSGMIAPGSHIHVFGSAENSEQGELALFTAILDDNRSKVVNYSWGSCESYVNKNQKIKMDKVFARSVAQGVNILVASGDSGSDGCGDGGVIADWPAAHPSLVAVGGTSVYLNSDKSKRERGWSGSGGGKSTFYKLPTWQNDFKAPFDRRAFPDISFNADPSTGQGIWVRQSQNSQPIWIQVGGTSMAAPQWVAFLALVNEARHAKGKQALGFINPILYKASQKDKTRIFTDIAAGKNGAYTAAKGWDAVTGWGSMRGTEMFTFLVAH